LLLAGVVWVDFLFNSLELDRGGVVDMSSMELFDGASQRDASPSASRPVEALSSQLHKELDDEFGVSGRGGSAIENRRLAREGGEPPVVVDC
jgi:hypothetical protein